MRRPTIAEGQRVARGAAVVYPALAQELISIPRRNDPLAALIERMIGMQ